jgi:iron complex outermembrane receptor protein
MKPNNPVSVVLLGNALALAGALAQSAPPAPVTGQEAALQMSPFVVQTDQDTGYVAANTLAGSRLNTSLKDTAASISVFTSEFMSDIGAFELSEVVRYAVNVEFQLDDDRAVNPNGNETVTAYQTYRVRGLKASVAQNYFRSSLPTESALVERIEDSRGPNSVLFGIASPGGLLNSTTKQAQGARSFQKGSFTLGSFNSWRGALDVNRRLLGGKLAVRLNTVYNRTNTFRHWQYQESQRAHLAGKYLLSDRTSIRAEFERGQINSNQPRADNLTNSVLLWHDSGRPTFATQTANAALGVTRQSTAVTAPRVTVISNNGVAQAMRGTLITSSAGRGGTGTLTEPGLTDDSINIGGPKQDRFSRFNQFSAYVEHRFARHTFLEVAYNHQDHTFDRHDPQVNSPQLLRGDPNQFMNDNTRNPYAGQLYLEGGWQRSLSDDVSDTGRIMISTELDARKWGNYRVAVLTEYDKSFTGSATYREMWVDAGTGLAAFNAMPENTANLVYRRTYLNEGDWKGYHIDGPGKGGLFQNIRDPITGRTLSSDWIPSSGSSPREVYTTTKSYMAAAQARYFEGRLIFAGGIRRDELDEYQQGRMRDARGVWIEARDPDRADPTQTAAWASNVGTNKTLGVVYHATPWLSVFYNKADNISLPARGQTRLPDDGTPGVRIPLEPPKGKGQDVGLAIEMFGGKVQTRATYYTTSGEKQSTTSPGPLIEANQRVIDALRSAGRIGAAEAASRLILGSHGLFDHKSEGLEFQTTVNVTRQFRLQGSYSYTKVSQENQYLEWRAWHAQNVDFLSKVNTTGVVTSTGRTVAEEIVFYQTTDNGLNEYIESDGSLKLGSRHHKMSFFMRYDFREGWLKGAYAGGGYTYQSKMFTGENPQRAKVWSPSRDGADAVGGYSFRGLPRNRALSVQLNIMNVFNDRTPIITRYSWETGTQRVFRRLPQAPLTWRLTTNFEF